MSFPEYNMDFNFGSNDLSFTGGNPHGPASPVILGQPGTSKQAEKTTRDDSQDLKLLLNKILETLMISLDSDVTGTQQSQVESQKLARCFQSAFGSLEQKLDQKLEKIGLEVAALREESKSHQRHCRPPSRATHKRRLEEPLDPYYESFARPDPYYESSSRPDPPFQEEDDLRRNLLRMLAKTR